MKEGEKILEREKIISKLNIKDYNNNLEKILLKKSFPEDVKSLLLSMLYKIETSYEDYKTVKIQVKEKREILEDILNIVEYRCNKIEVIKLSANDGRLSENKKYDVDKEKGEIISYPNEMVLMTALYELKDEKIETSNLLTIVQKPLQIALQKGSILNNVEIIRDFDGWNWNIVTSEINCFICNCIYQTITLLLRK